MKCLLPAFAFCCAMPFIHAQNIVSNGDFEQYDKCPVAFVNSSYYYGTDWFLPGTGSADYFNRCADAALKCCGVPCTILGYSETHGGDGMGGFHAYIGQGRREYLSVKLKQSLIAGKCYYFEMYVKPTRKSSSAIDHLGAYFSVPCIKDSLNPIVIPVSPQITSPRGIFFTENDAWQKISGVYTALGGEEYLIVGSFDFFPNTTPKATSNPGCTLDPSPPHGCYVYLDDVLLTENIPVFGQSRTIEIMCTETRRINVMQNQPGLTYKWNNGTTLSYLDIADFGTYWVETNWNNCATTVDTFVVKPAFPFSLGPDTTFCDTGSYTISAPSLPGFNYLWSTGSTTRHIVVDSPGIYWVRVQNDTCSLSDEIAIDMVPPIKPDLGNDLLICEGWPRQIDASQPGEAGRTYNYKWFRNNLQLPANTPTLDLIQSGTYRVIRSAATCQASDTIEVQTIPAPVPPILPDSFICDANSIRVSAGSPGFNTLWSTSETTTGIEINTPGTYWVTIGNNPPCIFSDTFTIAQRASPSGFLIADTSFCEGNTISINGTPGYVSYEWSTGHTADGISVNAPGTYSLKVSDGFCSNIETITVSQKPIPSRVLLTDSILCEKENEQFIISLPGLYQYTLDDAQAISDSLIITAHGHYELHITDPMGCSRIQQFNIYNYCEPTVYVPNAFSPNADGVNDLFTPIASFPDRINAFSMNIYNRWGEQILKSNSYGKGWDGTYQSLPAQADTYIYVINITWNGFGKDTHKQLKGNVTLLR